MGMEGRSSVPITSNSREFQNLAWRDFSRKFRPTCHTAGMRPILFLSALVVLNLEAARLEDAELQAYFVAEVEKIEREPLTDFKTVEEWKEARPRLREELFEMLSLSPRPEKTDLQAVVTGRVVHSP